jgi:hypothetical protein
VVVNELTDEPIGLANIRGASHFGQPAGRDRDG